MPIDSGKIKEVLKKNMEILEKKNADYSSMNLLIEGQKGVVTRLTDKVARLRNLLSKIPGDGSTINFESIMDTFGDIANYGIIGQLMQEGGVLPDVRRIMVVGNPVCRDLSESMLERMKAIGIVHMYGTISGVRDPLERRALCDMIIGWSDAVIVNEELSIENVSVVERAIGMGKRVVLVGEVERSEMTAKCCVHANSKNALEFLMTGGLDARQ
jgi:hypothetical protein